MFLLEAVSNARKSANEVATMSNIPDTLDTKLTRQATAEALTAAGFPVSEKTLATMATRGGGPLYQLFGRKPLYRWGDALEWAKGRLSKPVRTTSELEAA
jgi:hypothetical protein